MKVSVGLLGLLLAFSACKERTTAETSSSQNAGARGLAPVGEIRAGGACWAQRDIRFLFNPELSPLLDVPGGAGLRAAAVNAAVDVWNKALADIGAAQQLVFTLTLPGAVFSNNQAAVVCSDLFTRGVFGFAWLPIPGNIVGSAAKDSDPALGVNHGFSSHAEAAEAGSMNQTRTDVLGVAKTLGGGPNGFTSSTISFMTHTQGLNDDRVCDVIPWSFGVGPVLRDHYDFATVMLHEIGHALGLDHLEGDCAGVGGSPNVMQSMLTQGSRGSIGRCELDALAKLYGPGAPCFIK